MKTKQYVEKYGLNKSDKFNHSDFISDLSNDFASLLEIGNAMHNIKGFENAVRAIKMKWDAINNKTVGQLPEKLWGYFYASVIMKMKWSLFTEEMQRRESEKARRKEERERYKRMWDFDPFEGFRFSFEDVLMQFLRVNAAPVTSFELLGLNVDASVDEIKTNYRALSFKTHPDFGGDHNKFIELTEAKNKCLAWAQKK